MGQIAYVENIQKTLLSSKSRNDRESRRGCSPWALDREDMSMTKYWGTRKFLQNGLKWGPNVWLEVKKIEFNGWKLETNWNFCKHSCTLPTKSSKLHPPPKLLLRVPGSTFRWLKRMPSLLLLILSMWMMRGLSAHQLHIPWQQGSVESAFPFGAKGCRW